MNSVRAKFTVASVTHSADGNKFITAHPVTSGSEENKSFSKYTPSGRLELNISSETPAQDFFVPGKAFYLDFTEIPE